MEETDDQDAEVERFINEVEINLFTDVKQNVTCNIVTCAEAFVVESLGHAIVDTACARTCCGEDWYNDFKKKCHDNIEEESSSSLLKFGSAKPIMANKSVELPVKCEVLPVKVPLLLSNDTLSKSGTIIDVSNQKITMYGKEVPVERTSNGHFIINIMREKEHGKKQQEEETEDEFVNENIILMLTEETLDEKPLLKVHKQFVTVLMRRLWVRSKLQEKIQQTTSKL